MDESRSGESVTGSYSYVDPNGALITVNYVAGPEGYSETRDVQENFVQIRPRPVKNVAVASSPANGGFSVSGGSSSGSRFSAVRPAPVAAAPAPRAPAPRAQAPAPRPIAQASRTTGSVTDLFGSSGDFNVRFNTPSFKIEN